MLYASFATDNGQLTTDTQLDPLRVSVSAHHRGLVLTARRLLILFFTSRRFLVPSSLFHLSTLFFPMLYAPCPMLFALLGTPVAYD